MRTGAYVYILTSTSRVLYIGVTGNMHRRWLQHQCGEGSRFVQRYRVRHLVYVETCTRMVDALRREKQLKGWGRHRKVTLVEAMNPAWLDLARGWGWYQMLADQSVAELPRSQG